MKCTGSTHQKWPLSFAGKIRLTLAFQNCSSATGDCLGEGRHPHVWVEHWFRGRSLHIWTWDVMGPSLEISWVRCPRTPSAGLFLSTQKAGCNEDHHREGKFVGSLTSPPLFKARPSRRPIIVPDGSVPKYLKVGFYGKSISQIAPSPLVTTKIWVSGVFPSKKANVTTVSESRHVWWQYFSAKGQNWNTRSRSLELHPQPVWNRHLFKEESNWLMTLEGVTCWPSTCASVARVRLLALACGSNRLGLRKKSPWLASISGC